MGLKLSVEREMRSQFVPSVVRCALLHLVLLLDFKLSFANNVLLEIIHWKIALNFSRSFIKNGQRSDCIHSCATIGVYEMNRGEMRGNGNIEGLRNSRDGWHVVCVNCGTLKPWLHVK